MKPIKLFEEFIKDDTLNETVYSSGLGGTQVYSDIKKKTIKVLETQKWQKTNEGKFAISEANKLAKIWNLKDPSQHPIWFSEYTKEANGDLKPSNFISVTALIVAVLNSMFKPVSVEWLDSGLKRNHCFDNSIEWATQNNGTAIGGICMPKDAINQYNAESLIVHAFVKRDNKYFEVTIPNSSITNNIIYWPLTTFKLTTGDQISKQIWSLSLGIEEGVREYLLNL